MAVVTTDAKGYIESIEGDLDDEPTRALTVVEPDRLVTVSTPEGMVSLATRMATILSDVVEKRKLYATIQGRKFPTVEAWMTIGRMDGVVAREASVPIRHDDGSYEAVVELVRLSDGMRIGNGSALCGAPDDEPWGGTPSKYGKPAKGPRPEHQRRSMAVTRATSRAFRQQYSWIMALAGYEPTPADEMPAAAEQPFRADQSEQHESVLPRPGPGAVFSGTVAVGKAAPVDCLLRETPTGHQIGFRLFDEKRHRTQVICRDLLAVDLWDSISHDAAKLHGQLLTVEGVREWDQFTPKGETKGIAYARIVAEHLIGTSWRLDKHPTEEEQDEAAHEAFEETMSALGVEEEQELDAIAEGLT